MDMNPPKMSPPKINELRVFVPAKDFALSRDFYQALGWRLQWSDEQLALMEAAGQRFYLQNYYAKEWAENFMLHVSVDDAHAWHEHVRAVLASDRFPGARVSAPKQEAYGARVTYVWDPSGVLIHFAQWTR
ncbi:MAG: VOC family protein [Burkholderiaceae bacterium]